MRFGKVASFSGSYGFVPMKWVPQLNDIRISLPEFRGRSPTLILMLYVNELYVYCPSQSSVQDLYAGIIQLYPKINLEREIGFPVFFFGCRMPKSYSVSAWIWFIHRWMASMSRRFKFFWEFWMWMLFHVEDYLILPISCGIWRIERWIIQVLTVHRIILLIPNGRILQSGLATDRIWGSTPAVLFVELSRKRFQEAQSAKLNYFLCFIYLLLALSFASFFGYLFTQIN